MEPPDYEISKSYTGGWKLTGKEDHMYLGSLTVEVTEGNKILGIYNLNDIINTFKKTLKS
jgi:hypothetical protein